MCELWCCSLLDATITVKSPGSNNFVQLPVLSLADPASVSTSLLWVFFFEHNSLSFQRELECKLGAVDNKQDSLG